MFWYFLWILTPRDPKIRNLQVEIYISTERRWNPTECWWFRKHVLFFRKRFLTSSDFFWLFRDRSWPIRDFVKMLLISSDFFLNWGCIAFWIFCSDSHDAHEWYVVVRRSKKVRQKSRFVKQKSVISQTSNRGFIYRFLEVKLMISDWTVKNERWKLSFEIFTKKMKKIAKTNKKFRQILVFSSSPVICFETSGSP